MRKAFITLAILVSFVFVFCTAVVSQAVVIDLSNATVAITGPSSISFYNVASMGSMYWLQMSWNSTQNKFVVDAYGEMNQGECCVTSPDPGCSDPAIESCVCAADPFCCDVAWDSACVAEVESLGCGTCTVAGCTGQTCGTFTFDCNPALPGACGCFQTAEGSSTCSYDFVCDPALNCNTSADCALGTVCTVNTCCGVGQCVAENDCAPGAPAVAPITGQGLKASGN